MPQGEVDAAVAGYGPSEGHKKTFQESIFGTALGLATCGVLAFTAYVVSAVAAYRYFRDTVEIALRNDPGLYLVIAIPLVLVAYFLGCAAVKAIRERRVYKLANNPQPTVPGYFRLQPYELADKDQYKRPDGMLERALGWIASAEKSVLYLSGASGVGKSSLVAAGMTPVLQAKGWTVLFVRGMGAPLQGLTDTLRSLFDKAPAETDAYDLLKKAAGRLKLGPEARLLIVLDQFEEYLILDGGEEKAAYADFLARLDQSPIPFVHLLHVFREDYRALLFAQDFPEFDRRSGFELAPFGRAQAEAFLKGGPRQLDDKGYGALFEGLNRIEDTPGLYRPITLNMIGHVLERQGSVLAANPARLIADYIRACVTSGVSRDYNKPVLAAMITGEGTKRQTSVDDLSSATGLDRPKILAALYKLAEDGLVRPIGRNIWEISHDFLARLLGPILGRIRAPFVQRYGVAISGVTLVGWVGLAALAYPAWVKLRVFEAEKALQRAGINRVECEHSNCFKHNGNVEDITRDAAGEPIAITYRGIEDEDLAVVSELGWFNDVSLDLGGAIGISDLRPLRGLPLAALNISGASKVTDLKPLEGMELKSLDLSSIPRIESLEPLRGMPLNYLDLSGTRIQSLNDISEMPLNYLDLSYATSIVDLKPLQDMKLTVLFLEGASGITNLDPLSGMKLKVLSLGNATAITDIEPLSGMPLEWLRLGGTNISTLDPLRNMKLKHLDLSGATRVTNLEPLNGMPLEHLDLTGVIGISSLASLEGLDPVYVEGASEELLATLSD